jgi:hypothetical protein
LTNGRYKVHFEPYFKYSDYEIIVNDSSYTKYFKNDSIEGIIRQLPNNIILLKDIPKIVQPDTNRILKTIHDSFGSECIEISKIKNNKFYFRTTYTGNLHITINQGVFKKLRPY